MTIFAQTDVVSKLAHDAADSSDRYVIFFMFGLFALGLCVAIFTLYRAFIAQQKLHADFVTTVYTEGVKSQAILNVTIQDCTECLVKVKAQLEEVHKWLEKSSR